MNVLRAGRSQCKIERIRMVTHGRRVEYSWYVYNVILEHRRIVDQEEKDVVGSNHFLTRSRPLAKMGYETDGGRLWRGWKEDDPVWSGNLSAAPTSPEPFGWFYFYLQEE
jgi:hypothetical protein